jgi:hypothetical protein
MNRHSAIRGGILIVLLAAVVWRLLAVAGLPGRATVQDQRPVATASPTRRTPVTVPPPAVLATPTRALPSPSRPAPTPTATPRPAAPALPTATPGILTDIDAVVRAAETGQQGARFRVVLSEGQITQEIADYLRDNPDVQFRDVSVALLPGEAIITGKVRMGVDINAKATVTVVMDGRQPRLTVKRIQILGATLPGFATDRIAAMIEDSLDPAFVGDLPVIIEDITIQQGEVVFTGRVA